MRVVPRSTVVLVFKFHGDEDGHGPSACFLRVTGDTSLSNLEAQVHHHTIPCTSQQTDNKHVSLDSVALVAVSLATDSITRRNMSDIAA